MSASADDGPETVRIRRLPDEKRAFRSRAEYEIEYVGADGRRRRTTTATPERELRERIGSRHPADTSAWVEAADLGWDGGVGSWRSGAGPVDDDTDESEPTGPADPRVVARHARRIVDSRRSDSLASVLPFLAAMLERVGEPVLASEVGGVANDVMLASTPDERDQIRRRVDTLLASPTVNNLQPTRGSLTEQEVCRLLLARVAMVDR